LKEDLSSLLKKNLELRLEVSLTRLEESCRDKGDDPDGRISWPTAAQLDELSANIRAFSSTLQRGGKTTWSCIKAIDKCRPSIKLGKSIEDLVDRAARLYVVPRAIQIRTQGANGSERSRKCFAALRECFEGKSRFASIKWEEHHDILSPRPALRESCEARAAQICIDWLVWDREIGSPALALRFWLARIDNPPLAAKLSGGTKADAVFSSVRARGKEDKRKRNDAKRQKMRRLRLKRERP
jgi:hypothetical protein